MQILLIMNPTAGQEWKRIGIEPARVITDYFTKQHHKIDVIDTQAKGDATNVARKAVDDGYDMVIAAGGDGTVNEVVNGLVGSDVIFSCIPIGTENVLAKEMGIPFNIQKACEHISEAEIKRVDVGKLKDRYFLSFAGVGLDAHAVSEVPSKLKEHLGSLAFFITGLRMAWKYRKASPEATIILDDKKEIVVFWLIIVGNICTYGWKVRVTPMASMDDGFTGCMYVSKNKLFWRYKAGCRRFCRNAS